MFAIIVFDDASGRWSISTTKAEKTHQSNLKCRLNCQQFFLISLQVLVIDDDKCFQVVLSGFADDSSSPLSSASVSNGVVPSQLSHKGCIRGKSHKGRIVAQSCDLSTGPGFFNRRCHPPRILIRNSRQSCLPPPPNQSWVSQEGPRQQAWVWFQVPDVLLPPRQPDGLPPPPRGVFQSRLGEEIPALGWGSQKAAAAPRRARGPPLPRWQPSPCWRPAWTARRCRWTPGGPP